MKKSHRKILKHLASGCWIGARGDGPKTRPIYRGIKCVSNVRTSTLLEMWEIGLVERSFCLPHKPS